MILAADIGNTDTVIGVFEDGALKTHRRVATPAGKAGDEFLAALTEIFSSAGIKAIGIEAAVVSSVVPRVNRAFRAAVKGCTGRRALFVGEDIPPSMPVITENPAEVGADRIANAAAAFDIFKSPVIVVDFGTAITFDYVTGLGEYAGGAIAPGIGISMEALTARAELLAGVKFRRPERVVGRNTAECIRAGVYYGFAGLVDGIIDSMIREVGGTPKVIATGGMAGFLKGESGFIKETDEFLTIKGLKILYEGALK